MSEILPEESYEWPWRQLWYLWELPGSSEPAPDPDLTPAETEELKSLGWEHWGEGSYSRGALGWEFVDGHWCEPSWDAISHSGVDLKQIDPYEPGAYGRKFLNGEFAGYWCEPPIWAQPNSFGRWEELSEMKRAA